MKPLRYACCGSAGCSRLSILPRTLCPEHEADAKQRAKEEAQRYAARLREHQHRERAAWAHLYTDPRWLRLRANFLTHNPLCCICDRFGLPAAADEVDHVQPHRGDLGLFFDRSNLQALCKPCHSRKTADEVRAARDNADPPDQVKLSTFDPAARLAAFRSRSEG